MDTKVIDLLNDQINKEFYSAYLYLEFSNYYDEEGLDGFANWYYVQAQEERDHAMMFYRYLRENDIHVSLKSIDQPDCNLTDHMAPLKKGFEHEQLVTSLIHNIYDAAFSVKDFRTMQFLDWFINEQREEEKNASDMITKMELFGGDGKGLYMLNDELKGRVYTAPTTME